MPNKTNRSHGTLARRHIIHLSIAIALVGIGGVASANPPRSATVVSFDGTAVVRPVILSLTRNMRATGLRWTHWGTDRAIGTGTITYAGCNPTCSTAPAHRRHGRIVLTKLTHCLEGPIEYRRATVSVETAHGSHRLFTAPGFGECRPVVVVPDVTGMTKDRARRLLRTAGLHVVVTLSATTVKSQDDRVQDQRPRAALEAFPGTPVTIYVGHYTPSATGTTPTSPEPPAQVP